MTHDEDNGQAAAFLLQPITVRTLRVAVHRLRDRGCSEAEAATQMVRQNFFDWVDGEAETPGPTHRLRLVQP